MFTIIRTNYAEGVKVIDCVCASGDDKPTGCGNGSTCYEIDTGKTYHYNADTGTWTAEGAAKYLASITVTTPPTKTAYYDGDDFDATGAVITATYTDGTSSAVTASAVWPEKVHLGETEAVVTYTENGVVRTAEQAITVTAAE